MEKGRGKGRDTLHRDNDYLQRGDVKRLLENVVCLHEELPAQIDLIPAADVVPVVLCQDCDNWNDWDSVGKESLGNFRCSCAYWSAEDGPVFYTAPTDFCSYAEKREVEHD